jgi:hypothetical protein
MANTQPAVPSNKIITGEGRILFPAVFEPKENDRGELRYSLCFLIPKGDTATIAKINAAVDAMKVDPKNVATWGSKWLDSFKHPLRDGDNARDTDARPEWAGHYFINAGSKMRPGVVDVSVQKIIDPEEIYSGVYGRVSITLSAYNVDGGRGINCYLNNVQKTKDGERLAGGASAEEDFGPVADDDFLK